ncbi:hypothetical protein [uncultured Microbulbifer sp.]|uniref:hypothetical protein n=1 Tax=uncultured Microbulbifer sp. TaxID=348147 RepID=UPI0025E513DC|nr:hypothetical protein [uncultured Microbulbifer sp.]
MKVIKTMRPHERGAKRFVERYGNRLCAVRYRQSDCGTKVFTTVEVIVDERQRTPQGMSLNVVHAQRLQQPVALKVRYEETEIRQAIKHLGGKWSRQLQAWITTRDKAIVLGLAHRIEEGLAERCTDIDTSIEF